MKNVVRVHTAAELSLFHHWCVGSGVRKVSMRQTANQESIIMTYFENTCKRMVLSQRNKRQ